jgi:glycopeptide antibiotics resistance protein
MFLSTCNIKCEPQLLYIIINSMSLQKTWRSDPEVIKITNRLTTALFITYWIALFCILLFKLGVRFSYMGDRSVNLIPFRESLLYGKTDVGEIISNVVIFATLGIYAGILFKRWTYGNKIFFFFLISLLFEGLQFILKIGAFDITDIITNTSGGIIGLTIFKAIEKVFNNRIKAQKIVNLIAAIGTV